ncbi:maleylpyruvate isomerase family mycothiol-dependent enzyme [Acrocarpospora catenulata]|uniref:maleylpyruvate isomerase family mycothiol-dependent enzyme n=1 Tax=Acrocarpospora catenulata TaxID=2836182 RepID=UPI001BD9E725|nr:maleylpyruvate isomerase family mycothiol-dependent enzyme [Acrocarpospora catenulata]
MDLDQVWQAIDHERARLALLFDELTDEEWDTPSLCTGWRVREVAAHLTLAHTGALTVTYELLRARGNFNRMIHDTALRQARLPIEKYSELLRAMIGSRKKAPGITHLEPLIDVLVHAQDITIPLGRPYPIPPEPAAAAATRVWTMGWPFNARRNLTGLKLTATDHPWTQGHGTPLEGPMGALLLLLTGRGNPLNQLSGPGIPELLSRQTSR